MINFTPTYSVIFIGFYRQTRHGIISEWNRHRRFDVEDVVPISLGGKMVSLLGLEENNKGRSEK